MNTEAQHTPGPWKVVGTEIWVPHVRIASEHGAYDEKDRAKNRMNAHLISAAPDMYAALKAIDQYFDKTGIPGGLLDQLLEARAALAKAEGR